MSDGAASDAQFDALFAGLSRWSESERSAYCAELEDHPLFLSASPTAAQVEGNAALSALAAVAYDEHDTPLALGEAAKAEGNAAFALGPAAFGQALKLWRDAAPAPRNLRTGSTWLLGLIITF